VYSVLVVLEYVPGTSERQSLYCKESTTRTFLASRLPRRAAMALVSPPRSIASAEAAELGGAATPHFATQTQVAAAVPVAVAAGQGHAMSAAVPVALATPVVPGQFVFNAPTAMASHVGVPTVMAVPVVPTAMAVAVALPAHVGLAPAWAPGAASSVVVNAVPCALGVGAMPLAVATALPVASHGGLLPHQRRAGMLGFMATWHESVITRGIAEFLSAADVLAFGEPLARACVRACWGVRWRACASVCVRPHVQR
jgi:hypothetical protein